MARYDWPGERDPQKRDRARFRAEALFEQLAGVPGQILAEASAARASLLGALLTDPDLNVWLPIGPSVTIEGQAGSAPRVTGRVRDLAVSDDGQRVYAATANGGVWYSSDAGVTWSALGAAASTPIGEALAPGPNSLATSCLLVTFGANPDGSQDVVYAGTGEIRPYSAGYPGGKAAGIGVLKLAVPLPDALAHPEVNPWRREAVNLSGMGIFRLARNPGAENTLLAATSTGLWKRQGAFVEGANWVRVTAGPFDFDADDDKWCTDVIWEPAKGGTPARLWVALLDDTLFTDTGIWVSEGGADGPYEKVGLSDSDRDGRLGISVHKKDPSVVYVLGKGPRLWRIDGKTARRVRGLPKHLFGAKHDQSAYDLAVAVHPEKPDEVIVGGSTVSAEQTTRIVDGRATLVGGHWSASLFRLTVSGTAAADDFACNFDDAKQDAPGTDSATFIGNNVHADVHVIRYTGAPAGAHVWIGCDGGVYQSTQGGEAYTFIARNNGLSVIEAGYVACHPTLDGAVIVGTQDNGALTRIGNTIWKLWIFGDGGGVAFHPAVPAYYAGQYTRTGWYSNDGDWVPPVDRQGCSEESVKRENNASAFYSDLHVIPGAANKARVALGSNRVWISEDWDPSSATKMTWQTLPSGKDPRRNGANNVSSDAFDAEFGSVRVVQWAGPPGHPEDRVVALCGRAIVLFTRDTGTGKWSKKVLSRYNEKCGDDEMDNDEIGQTSSPVMPPKGAWSDLAVQDPGRAPNGSYYVAATGFAKFDDDTLEVADRMDTLWWFDGVDKWYPTGLYGNAKATRAPGFAVAVDPDDVAVVYAGTSVGVWKGTLSFVDSAPEWDWEIFSNGLPDAYVQDLAFFKNGDQKLLRAALQARGVWEVDLSTVPSPPRRTYLRVHEFDTRRVLPAQLINPESKSVPPSDFDWNESPDVVFRPAPGAPAPLARPGSLPWTRTAYGSRYDLWVVQTAMHAGDPLVRPTGKWTHQLDARIKAYRARHSLPNPDVARVDAALWNHAVVTGTVYANPWDGAEPTEADLKELMRHETFRVGGSRAVRVEQNPYRVEVLVHHRHFQPVPAADVRVLLLRLEITDPASNGAAVPLSAAWKAAVVQRLGGATPAIPDGWEVVGLRSPTGPVSAMIPRVATFDVDFSVDPPFTIDTRWIFLAVVSAATDEATEASLAGGTLRDLVLGSHHVAARLVYVFL